MRDRPGTLRPSGPARPETKGGSTGQGAQHPSPPDRASPRRGRQPGRSKHNNTSAPERHTHRSTRARGRRQRRRSSETTEDRRRQDTRRLERVRAGKGLRGNCYNCGEHGHTARDCKGKGKGGPPTLGALYTGTGKGKTNRSPFGKGASGKNGMEGGKTGGNGSQGKC